MRNLKRTLSLTLASVMLLGMMVVGTSAAGYDDVKETDNVEAIEVLQEIKVMVGDERGFGPERPVNRAEMAVVMGKLLSLDYNYYATSCPFNDVYDWARGWVGACAANKIVSGRGDGIYDPGATVTAVEAASMLMRALGYFQYANDYADGFELSTVRQGTKIGIFKGVGSSATEPMTRNQVAQMVLNALQSDVVEPDGNTINLTTPDGTVLTGKVNYVSVTRDEPYAWAIGKVSATSIGSQNSGAIVELGERLYNGDLKLFDDRTDAFGRPSRYWEYDGKAIGTYVKKELLKQEYTVEVKGKDLYDLLGSDIIKEYAFDVTIDGVSIDEKTGSTEHNTVLKDNAKSYFDQTFMAKTYKSKVGQTGKGVLTQVFVDPEEGKDGKVWVSVINTYLAKATADYNEKKDEAKLDVYALTSEGNGAANTVYYKYIDKDTNKLAAAMPKAQTKNLSVASEDFAKAADIKKDDIFLVTQANGEIKTLTDPEVLSSVTMSKFSKDSYVVTEGTQYDYNTTVDYDPDTLEDYTGVDAVQQLKNTEYNVYLDPYGYLIGVEVVEAVKNYVFLTGIDQGTSNLNNKTADAAGILTDGTFINFKMNMTDSRTAADGTTGGTNANPTNSKTFYGHALWNTWCTYTVDKDGSYTLKEVGNFDSVFNAPANAKAAKAGQYADFDYANRDIDHKHVSLRGKASNGFVYGNDDSVYLLAELKQVTAKNTIAATCQVADGTVQTPNCTGITGSASGIVLSGATNDNDKVGIISGVASMGVGIDNVSIKTFVDNESLVASCTPKITSPAFPGYVYTLFDDDGYVIAAVVLGEDQGTNKNLVYSHKNKLESEEYDSTNDIWTWTRKVIKDGEEILLTQTGDDADKANSLYYMAENAWYEVNMKADGTVRSVKGAYYTEGGKLVGNDNIWGGIGEPDGPAMTLRVGPTVGSGTAGDFVDTIENLEAALNDNVKDTTTLYEQVWGIGEGNATSANSTQLVEDNRPSLIGSTLYVNTDARKGFYVHKDVKSVLIQTNNGDTTTDYGTGTSDLESFLKELNFKDASKSYCFKISAILTDGRATVVVIHDWNGSGATQSGDRNPTKGDHPAGILVDMRTKNNLKYYNSKKAVSSDEAAQDISQWLVDEGWEILEGPEYDDASSSFVWKATQNGGKTKYTFNWAPSGENQTKAITVSVNGVPYAYKAADGCATLLALAGVDSDEQSSYIKRTQNDTNKTVSFNTAAGHGTTLADGDQLTTGYLAVVDNTGSGADVSGLVDMTGLEAASGAGNTAQHYALPTTAITKLGTENAGASGLAAGAASSLAYVPYVGGTYGTINQKDGTPGDWKAQIGAIGKVKVTFVDHTVGATTTTFETAQAVASLAAGDHSGLNVTSSKTLADYGTYYYINSTTSTEIAEDASSSNALTDGCTVHIGYVKVTKANDTAQLDDGLTYSLTAPATGIVAVNSDVTVTLRAAGTASAVKTKTLTTVAANATIKTATGAITANDGSDVTGLTSVSVTDNHTVTIVSKAAGAVDATYTFIINPTGADDVVFTMPTD